MAYQQPKNRNEIAVKKSVEGTEPFYRPNPPYPENTVWEGQKTNRNIQKTNESTAMLLMGVSAKGEKTSGDASRCNRYCVKNGMIRPTCPICRGTKGTKARSQT